MHASGAGRYPVLVQIGEGARLQGGGDARLRGDVDQLARSPAARPQAQQDGDGRVDAREVFGLVLRQPQGRAVGVADLGEHPARRGHHEIAALPVAARPDETERGDTDVYEVIDPLGECAHPALRPVEDGVGARQQSAQRVRALGGAPVEGHRAFAGVPVGEVVAVGAVPVGVALRGLHQYHLVTQADQQSAGEAGEGAGQLDDPRDCCGHVFLPPLRPQPWRWFRKPVTAAW